MDLDLNGLWEKAKESGWASSSGASYLFEHYAEQQGWKGVETRAGEGTTSVLRPTSRAAAHPRSISAVHGLDEQPLHVDGSHLPLPPDAVVLFSEAPTVTPTNLWHFDPTRNREAPVSDMRHGIFVVGSGPWAFLSTAWDGERLRYDPVIMEPADARARAAAAYLNSVQTAFTPFQWEAPNTILVIDNRRVLHGRAKMAEGDDDRKLVRKTFYVEGLS
ncbi:TauD/TfdA family dioxygenase [Paenarthrobacter nitroguajacolicus]